MADRYTGRGSPGAVGYDPYAGGKCTALDTFPKLHYFSNNLFEVFNKYVVDPLVAGRRGRTGSDLNYRASKNMPITEFLARAQRDRPSPVAVPRNT